MRRSEVLLLLVIAALAGAVLFFRHRALAERLERHNAEAQRDTSRIVHRSAMRTVAERLAFQQTANIQLRGELGQVLRAKNEQTQLLARVQVRLDSLAGVVTTGTVTVGADSSLRQLAASIDTAGYHVRVTADVPRPPAKAVVRWDVTRDPVEIVAALNRDPDGRLALRVASGPHAEARIDTVRVQISRGLGQTQKLAGGLLVAVVFYSLGRLVR